jgi:hypothetical protein
MRSAVALCCTLLLLCSSALQAQVISNNGAVVSISSGTVLNGGDIGNTTGTISNSGTITLTGTYTNAATTNGNGTYNLAGNWINNGGTFTAGSSIVNLNGSSAQSIGGSTSTVFNTLQINNAAGVTLGIASTVTTLTIGNTTANSIFDDGGFGVTSSGTLNLTSGTFRLGSAGAATAFPLFAANNISAGTTVEYASGIAQNVSNVPTYSNLKIANASSAANYKTALGTLTISGTLTINSGNTLDMGSFASSTFGGSSTNSGTIRWSANNVFLNGTGTTEFYSSSAGNVVAGTYGNLWFTGSGTKTISGGVIATGGNAAFGVTVSNNLTISGTGNLTVTGMDLNNDGTITNNGTITVQ